MARIVLLVNIILFSLSWTAASASSDVEVSPTSIAESLNVSNSSSSDGSPRSSDSESYLASKTARSSKSSEVFSSGKNAPAICPKGKKKSCCPKHEVRVKCIQAYCKPQKCSERGRAIPSPTLAGPCKKGCVCARGYLRNSKGRCIPENRCPPVCPINEEFSNCTQAVCRQETCKDKKMPLSCPAINEGDCNSGCVCQSGYLRTPEGECVPQNQCSGDLVCKTNEVVDNCPNSGHGDCCPQSEKDAKLRKQSKVITECEEQSCTCQFNYMRADNGTCIPARDCPPFNCTGENEEFNPCPPFCPTDDCAQATPSGRCPLPGRIGIVLQCRADCRCKSGFWRKNGVCVPYSECPGICPLNEEYSDCIQGVCRAQNCTQKGKPIACAGIAEGSCEKGCICSTGFLRDGHGNCIPDDECPAPKCDGQNEVLAECPNGCDPINCPESLQAEQEKLAGCSAIAVCLPPECRCRPDYRRDGNGTCILIEECPGICPDHEEYSNCTQALCRAQNCTQIGKSIACAGIAEGSCERGCVCSNGFLRDEHGNCVPEDQCSPGAPVCDDNEVAVVSRNNATNDYCPRFEGDKGEISANTSVVEGPVCVCRFNHRRSYENKTCIPTADCPSFECNRPYEEYRSCPPRCPSDDCSQATPTGRCPIFGRIGIVLECNPKCRCIQGYWRDNGTCVPYAACPGKCPTNERYSSCIQAECRALNCTQKGKTIACPRVAPGVCKNGCVCVEGTLRAENGSCIPETECPVCPAHEEFSNCTQAVCRQQTCKDKKLPLSCPAVNEGDCNSGCVCQSEYLRTPEGKCVPQNQCSGNLVCKNNEVVANCPNSGHGDYCPKSEKDAKLRKQSKVITECEGQSCTCQFNYMRADNGTCIPARDCPGICPLNEEYSDCIQDVCRAQNCTQKGKPIACAGIAEGSCEKGCICSTGFLRDGHGNCIPDDECPAPKCNGQNEVLAECPNGCDPVNCPESLQAEQEKLAGCSAIAVCLPPECRCRPDYRRDEKGTCVPIEECPGICPDNEEFSNCTQALCRAQNCTQKGKPIICPMIVEGSCEKGCVCLTGFLRDEHGNCIPDDQCPAPKCHGQNEVLSECPNGCDPINCPKSFKAEQERLANCFSPAVCLPPACRCRPDYRRDIEGRCIYIGECPGICPINEEFSNCIQAICRAQNCTEKGKSIACPEIPEGICKKGCVCSTGYLRDDCGNCVPDDQCPGPQQPQCRVNEVLSCVNDCPPERTCRNRKIQFRCREPTKKCENKCICKPGYYKNYLGDCITEKQCDQCSAPNEFFSCGSACDNECKTMDTQNRTNCPIINIVCNPKCYCEDGYARNERNQCIPVGECPKPNLCGPNEEYVNCKKTCPPELCFSLVARFKCSGKPQCIPGCACKPGFLRKKDGSPCVPICDCSEMKNSPDCKKPWPNSNY